MTRQPGFDDDDMITKMMMMMTLKIKAARNKWIKSSVTSKTKGMKENLYIKLEGNDFTSTFNELISTSNIMSFFKYLT